MYWNSLRQFFSPNSIVWFQSMNFVGDTTHPVTVKQLLMTSTLNYLEIPCVRYIGNATEMAVTVNRED